MPYKDPEIARERQRAYYEANKDRQLAHSRAWAKRNPEKSRASKQRWIEKNRELNAARRREYRRKNREKIDALKRRWERENPDRVAAARALRRIRDAKTKLAAHLRYHYSLTVDDYLALLTIQGGKCAICGVAQNDHGRWRRLNLDHDHKTGRVRGLLCTKCNSALGYFSDTPGRLRRAADYLEGALHGQARLLLDGPGERSRLDEVLGKVSKGRSQKGCAPGLGATQANAGDRGPDAGDFGMADTAEQMGRRELPICALSGKLDQGATI